MKKQTPPGRGAAPQTGMGIDKAKLLPLSEVRKTLLSPLNGTKTTQLAVWCEQAESDAAGGKPLNIGEYATATNTLRRLLQDLGLERRMRDITPTVDAYLSKGKA